MHRRIVLIVNILICIMVFASCSIKERNHDTMMPTAFTPDYSTYNRTGTGPYVAVFAHQDKEDSFVGESVQLFKALVEERTNKNVIIDVYPNGSLGGLIENNKGIRNNTIQMVSSLVSSTHPGFGAFELPNLFNSREQIMQVFDKNGETFRLFSDLSESIGIKLFSIIPTGFRNLSSNTEIRSVEDIQGQNIRVMQMPIPKAYWRALEANPIPMAISELYFALQQGIVDAQENPYDIILANKLYEQQKYIIETNHQSFFVTFCMNMEFWNSLPPEYQGIILEVMNEVDAFTYQNSIDREKSAKEFMMNSGIEVIVFTPEDHAAMRTAAEPIYDMIREEAGAMYVDAVIEAASLYR